MNQQSESQSSLDNFSLNSFSLSNFSLNNKVALITGASSGIGATLAEGLAVAGAKVVVAARREDKLQALVEKINSRCNNTVAFAVPMDVTNRESIRAAFDLAESRMGVINVLINNAGVAEPKSFLKTSDASRDFVMDTNFKGVWNVAQEAAQRMVAANTAGSIVNVASILGVTVKPGQAAYCASKGAVIQLTRALALDLMKHNIRVNALAPGWFKTEINDDYFESAAGQEFIARMPAKRLGRLEELIGPVVMLCSDAASFMNGIVLPVDGAISVTGI